MSADLMNVTAKLENMVASVNDVVALLEDVVALLEDVGALLEDVVALLEDVCCMREFFKNQKSTLKFSYFFMDISIHKSIPLLQCALHSTVLLSSSTINGGGEGC